MAGLGGAGPPDPYGGNPVKVARAHDLPEFAMPRLVPPLTDVITSQ